MKDSTSLLYTGYEDVILIIHQSIQEEQIPNRVDWRHRKLHDIPIANGIKLCTPVNRITKLPLLPPTLPGTKGWKMHMGKVDGGV